MSVLRAEKILDYLASPLSRCLRDENPYVRKTAALCVAKVFDLKPELCIEYGFIETLRDLIGDGNPMVSRVRHGRYCTIDTLLKYCEHCAAARIRCPTLVLLPVAFAWTTTRFCDSPDHVTNTSPLQGGSSPEPRISNRCRDRRPFWLVANLNSLTPVSGRRQRSHGPRRYPRSGPIPLRDRQRVRIGQCRRRGRRTLCVPSFFRPTRFPALHHRPGDARQAPRGAQRVLGVGAHRHPIDTRQVQGER
jgi:hypothetical protein